MGPPVVLSLDQTDLGDRFAVLMLGLVLGDRALPLAWAVEAGPANLGLIDSYGRETRAFGHQVLTLLKALMAAVYAAREGPPTDLPTRYAEDLARLRATCERLKDHTHAKTRALAVELLNDGEAIFQVLHHPELPLTNNEAERALRHWVILRKISQGTRTPTGSRTFTVRASVITTCRQRGHSLWLYLCTALADRRAGRPWAPLPTPVMQGV